MRECVRVMRGQIVIREDRGAYHGQTTILIPELGTYREQQERRTVHRGRVLAMGPPARTRKEAEVPPGFSIGDEVIFHWTHLEKAWTREWIDGEEAVWIPQQNVDAVIVRE